MFRAAHRSSSGDLNCICSHWFRYPCGDRPLPRLSLSSTQPWQRPVTITKLHLVGISTELLLAISPSPVAVPMRRAARSWTQIKHTKEPSCFRRYLWSPEWPYIHTWRGSWKIVWTHLTTDQADRFLAFSETSVHCCILQVLWSYLVCEWNANYFVNPFVWTVQGGQTCTIEITCDFTWLLLFRRSSDSPLYLLCLSFYPVYFSPPQTSVKCYATCCILRKSIWGLSSDLLS